MPLYLSDLSSITEEAPVSTFLHCMNYTEGIVMLPNGPCPVRRVGSRNDCDQVVQRRAVHADQ